MKKSLTRNAAFNIAYRLLNVVFPLVSATYIARVLSPEGVGRVAYAQNIVSYFLMLAVSGIPQYGTREIAKCREDKQQENKIFTELFIINVVSTTVCVAAYYVFIRLALKTEMLMYTVVGLELLFNFINIDWFYQGEEEYVYITLRSVIIKLLSLLALFLFVKDQKDYIIYALIHCMGIGGNYLFNILHARHSVRLVFSDLDFGRHAQPIMTLMVSAVMASLYSKVDITMLGWLSTDEAVGFYINAHKVISIVLTLVTALSAVFLPRLSYVYQNEREQYGRYLTVGLKVVLFLALPSCTGIVLVADNLIQVLFGSAFKPAGMTMQILAILTIVKGAGDLLCYQSIISSGNEGKLVKSRVVAGVMNVILNALLIPRYGPHGAAIASVASEIVVNGMLLPTSLKIAKPKINPRFCVSISISTGAMAIIAWWIQAYMGEGVVSLIVAVLAGMVVYFVVAVITKNDVVSEMERIGINTLRRK